MYSTMVTAICDFLKSVFNYADTAKEKQSETEIIKDKRDYKKATDVAERIIEIADKYLSKMNKDDLKEYQRLCKRFRKYN